MDAELTGGLNVHAFFLPPHVPVEVELAEKLLRKQSDRILWTWRTGKIDGGAYVIYQPRVKEEVARMRT